MAKTFKFGTTATYLLLLICSVYSTFSEDGFEVLSPLFVLPSPVCEILKLSFRLN